VAQRHPDRSIVGLIADVISDLANLFQTELRLVRVEMNEKFHRLVSGGILIGAGAVAMLAALIILLFAIVRWLEVAGVPQEWGLLIVGLAVAVVGIALLLKGINNFKRTSLVPNRTIHQMRADVSVVREHVP
jgi:hypothetical protein